MSKYFSISWLLLGIVLLGPSTWAKATDYLPTGLELGVDVASPLYYYTYQKIGLPYECNVSVDVNRLLLQGDYGGGYLERQGFSKQTGKYFRVGLDYNFIKKSKEHNAAFLGFRYAKSYFQDQLVGELRDGIWENHQINSTIELGQMRWFEIVTGVRVKVWTWIYMGCAARYKFSKQLSPRDRHIPFDMLGWGLNEEDAWGLNYYLIVRIPLQKSAAKPYTQAQ